MISLIISLDTLGLFDTFALNLFQQLETVIKARLPGITSMISKRIEDLEAELDHLGRPTAIDAGVRDLQTFLIFGYKFNFFQMVLCI